MTVKINLSRAASRADTGSTLPLTYGQPRATDHSMTATSSSVASSLVAQDGEVWEITPDVDIVVAFGSNPNAGGSAVRFLGAGIPRTFGVLAAGEKIAIKTP